MKRARGPNVDDEARRRFMDETWVRAPSDGRRRLVSLAQLGHPLADLDVLRRFLPVVDDGNIQVGPSTIPGAGRGLFASRDFVRGELVTFYGGPIARYHVPFTSIPRRQRSHLRVLIPHRYFLIGDAPDARLGEPGSGGGALINDGPVNVEFASIDSASNEMRVMAGAFDELDPFQRLVVVRTLRPIAAGQEFFVSYGGVYWAETDVGDEDDDGPDVEFDLVRPASTPVTGTETKRRRIAPIPVTHYAARRCDSCLVRGVAFIDHDQMIYYCADCLEPM